MHCGMFTPMGIDTVAALRGMAKYGDMTDEEREKIIKDAVRKGGGASTIALRCMMAERGRIFAQLEAILDAAQTPPKEHPDESTIERVRLEIESAHKAGHELEDARDAAWARAETLERLGRALGELVYEVHDNCPELEKWEEATGTKCVPRLDCGTPPEGTNDR